MKEYIFKRSAIHNLVITKCKTNFKKGEIMEGIVIPKNILEKSDIKPWEQVIVTKINGNNWSNRIKTFVIQGKSKGNVEVRGSLAKFLKKGDLTCLITRTFLDNKELAKYRQNKIPIFDLGFVPSINKDNSINSRLDIEYESKKIKNVGNFIFLSKKRENIKRLFLSSLILNLKINKINKDCLQGSAEIPGNIINKAYIKKYQSVSVYNFSKGGIADTYVVPMPPKIVMTTGAMARFARKGEIVNVATYCVSIKDIFPNIIYTNGSEFVKTIQKKSK